MTKTLAEGDVLESKYRIIRRIGEGGMGVVYEAEHEMLKRRCAVKVLHPAEAEDASMLARFRAEAQSAANIRHRNIVEVMDFGVTGDDFPFFVMEFLEGESLADRLDRQKQLGERAAVEVIDQVLAGLARAHKGGVIHRDLKPENIFIGHAEDGHELVKLLDFGISKMVAGVNTGQVAAAAGRPKTQQGVVLGTPGYMAPESIFGGEVDPRADLFSVGVVLYEMLTGRRPFRGETVQAVLISTTTDPVPRPGAYNAEMSDAMERLILTALAKDPDDRFSTAEEFIRQLTAAAVGRVPDNARPCRTKVGMASVAPPRRRAPVDQPRQVPRTPPTTARPQQQLPTPAAAPRPSARGSSYVVPAGATRTTPLKPKRFNMFVSPLTLLLLLAGLGGAYYYLFHGDSALLIADERDEVGDSIERYEMARRADRSAEGTAAAGGPTGGATETPTREPVTIWLDASPPNVAVMWNGVPISERPLVVKAGYEPVEVVFTAPGYKKLVREITPNADQTVRVRLERSSSKKKKMRRKR